MNLSYRYDTGNTLPYAQPFRRLRRRSFAAYDQIPSESPVFGVIAMLRSEKGQRNFVNAATRVLRSAPNARFVIVGGGRGSYADSLNAKIRQQFPVAPSPVVVTESAFRTGRVCTSFSLLREHYSNQARYCRWLLSSALRFL